MGILSAGLVFGQTTVILPQNASVSTGTVVCVAGSTITASGTTSTASCLPPADVTSSGGFLVSGTASVTFEAGSSITLLPGFDASAGSSGMSFHALIGTVPQVFAPVVSPGAGAYTTAQAVSIGSATAGATIRYTLDGTTPGESYGTLYTAPILVSSSATVNAIAYNAGMLDSAVSTVAITINQPVATPQFSVPAGIYSTAQSVSITSTTASASIRYTTDGITTPSESVGTLYTGPVTVSNTTALQAIAYRSGLPDSAISSATYTIAPAVAVPVFSPPAGTYQSLQMISMSSATSGASIWYTTDGSTPSNGYQQKFVNSLEYCNFCAAAPPTTFNAIAVDSGLPNSSISSATYNVVYPGVTMPPVISPSYGVFNSPHQVTITSLTSGAAIRYTLDGTTPSETNGTLYGGPFTVPVQGVITNIAAIAYAPSQNLYDSPIAWIAYFSTTATIANPVITPNGGNFGSSQTVTIATSSSGASIRYTTDGVTVPTETVGTFYEGPISVSGNATIQAIAYESGYLDSGVTSASFSTNNSSVLNTPIVSPAPGSYTQPTAVSLSADPGATIYYTTNGNPPDQTSDVYFGPLTITTSATVQAYAAKVGRIDSRPVVAGYSISSGGAATSTATKDYIRLGSRVAAIENSGPPPAFSIVGPATVSAQAGTSALVNVFVTGQNGFSSSVGLSLAGAPGGVTYSFSPASITPGVGTGTVSLRLVIPSTTATGVYVLTVTGSSTAPSMTQSVVFALTVTAPPASPNFSIGISSVTNSAITIGMAAQYTISVTGVNGFSSLVSFSASGLPAGVTATFSPTTVTGSGSTTMTLTPSITTPKSATPPLPFTVTATASVTGQALSSSASSTLIVIHDAPIWGSYLIPAAGSSGVFSVGWAGAAPGDVTLVQVDLYTSDATAPTCEVFYHPDTGAFYLTQVLTNSSGVAACSIASGGSATWNGSVLTTNFSLQFNPSVFSGQLDVAFAASNAAGEDGGGQFGYFTVQ